MGLVPGGMVARLLGSDDVSVEQSDWTTHRSLFRIQFLTESDRLIHDHVPDSLALGLAMENVLKLDPLMLISTVE